MQIQKAQPFPESDRSPKWSLGLGGRGHPAGHQHQEGSTEVAPRRNSIRASLLRILDLGRAEASRQQALVVSSCSVCQTFQSSVSLVAFSSFPRFHGPARDTHKLEALTFPDSATYTSSGKKTWRGQKKPAMTLGHVITVGFCVDPAGIDVL